MASSFRPPCSQPMRQGHSPGQSSVSATRRPETGLSLVLSPAGKRATGQRASPRVLDAVGTHPRPEARSYPTPVPKHCRVWLRGCGTPEPSSAGSVARRVGGRPRRPHRARGAGSRAGGAGVCKNRSFLLQSRSQAGASWGPTRPGERLRDGPRCRGGAPLQSPLGSSRWILHWHQL